MADRRPRVLFHVQHLLGIGHLRRAALLAQAMAGLDVTVAQGGMPSDLFDFGDARMVQLPPIRSADAGFGGLVDGSGGPLDGAAQATRRDALLALFDRVRPDLVLLESFPFGRRQLRFELLPLLDRIAAAHPRPRVAVSIRDVLQRRAEKRERETVAIVRANVDRVLVHGDRLLIDLAASFGHVPAIADRLCYTGYVAPPPPLPRTRDHVLVSAGGGAVGAGLLRAALAARPLSRLANRPWTLLTGPHLPDGALGDLRAAAPDGVSIRRSVPDLAAVLAGAVVSLSQGGYNTLMDLAVSGAPAVIVPFAGDGETEQPMRAARLAALGAVQVVDEAALTPAALARALDAALDQPPSWPALALDGAATTASELLALIERGGDTDHD